MNRHRAVAAEREKLQGAQFNPKGQGDPDVKNEPVEYHTNSENEIEEAKESCSLDITKGTSQRKNLTNDLQSEEMQLLEIERLPTRARRERNELTEEELIAYRAKEAERARNYRARMRGKKLKIRRATEAEKNTLQQLPTRARRERNELTEEELIAYRAKGAERSRNYRARMREEDLKIRRAADAKRKRLQRAKLHQNKETVEYHTNSENENGESKESCSLEITIGTSKRKRRNNLTNDLQSEEMQLVEIEKLKIAVRALKRAGLEIIRTRVADAVKDLLGVANISIDEDAVAKIVKRITDKQLNVRSLNNALPNADEVFPCSFCTLEYLSKASLAAHLRTHSEAGIQDRKWPVCKRKQYLKVHPCEVCPEKLTSIIKYREHLLECHKECKELIKKNCFSCPFCEEKLFVHKQIFTRHLRDLHDIYILCPVCSESITTQALFIEHVNTSHLELSKNDKFLEYSGHFICKMCGIACRHYGVAIEHYQNMHSDSKIFQCDCGKSFAIESALRQHKARSHSKKYFCEKCEKRYQNQHAFKKHVKTHEGENGVSDNKLRLPCLVTGCTQTFGDYRSRRTHFVDVHKPRSKKEQCFFPCPVCEKNFATPKSLETHREMVCEKEVVKKCSCEVCGKVLDSRYLLTYHRNNFHKFGNTNETFCHRCNKEFSSCMTLYGHNISRHRNKDNISRHRNKDNISRHRNKDNISRHRNKDNTKKKCFSCPFCEDVCSTKKNLTWHFRDIHEIYVQCPICDEYIKTQELFAEHVNVSHSKLSISDTILQHSDLYVCKVCGIAQNSYNSITQHFQNLHSEARCFQCDICGKAFATELSKKGHTIKSHGERSFMCENCGKTYRDFSAFKKHVRTHDNGGPQNEPRVPCMVPGCAKTFANKNSFRRHFQGVHKNERNFSCPVCGKVFNSSASLSLHKVNVCEKDKAKKVPCPVCGKVLDNFYLLSYHKNNFHRYGNTEETFCHRCNKNYSSSFALYSHNNHAHRNKDKDTEHVKPRIPKKRKNTNRAPSYTSESGDYVDFSQANVHESLMKSARENSKRSTEVATSSLAAQSMHLGFW